MAKGPSGQTLEAIRITTGIRNFYRIYSILYCQFYSPGGSIGGGLCCPSASSCISFYATFLPEYFFRFVVGNCRSTVATIMA